MAAKWAELNSLKNKILTISNLIINFIHLSKHCLWAYRSDNTDTQRQDCTKTAPCVFQKVSKQVTSLQTSRCKSKISQEVTSSSMISLHFEFQPRAQSIRDVLFSFGWMCSQTGNPLRLQMSLAHSTFSFHH